jgi:hypothetical protein
MFGSDRRFIMMPLARRALATVALIAASFRVAADAPQDQLALLPSEYRAPVASQLSRAADNRQNLLSAIDRTPSDQRPALAFLLANMPDIDLQHLSSDLLVENVALATQAKREAPWSAQIPDEVFLDAVLPYASINERREPWRKDFHDRFTPWVAECKTPGDAALILNKRLFKEVKVRYHPTLRPKPDQSPSESIGCGYASCSGLSVLLIDACRAVGVPARFVGTPSWTTGKGDANGNHGGNHSWVEVWDGHQWRVLGASEVSPLDKTWFMDNASKADPTDPIHRIYATTFQRGTTHFPLVWDETIEWVPAEDVTQSYLARTTIRVKTPKTSAAEPAHVQLTFNDHLVAQYVDEGQGQELTLSGGQTYEAQLLRAGDPVRFTLRVPPPAANKPHDIPEVALESH